MNVVVHRSHFSLRLRDVSPQVRKGLWKHAVASFGIAGGVVGFCVVLVWWVAG